MKEFYREILRTVGSNHDRRNEIKSRRHEQTLLKTLSVTTKEDGITNQFTNIGII